jgi:leucyl aminopeptidase
VREIASGDLFFLIKDSQRMQLTAQFASLNEVKADCLVIGVYEDEAPPTSVVQLDARLGSVIARLRQAGDITGKANELVPLYECKNTWAQRLLVVGLGPKAKVDHFILRDAAAAAARSLTGKARERIAFALPDGGDWTANAVTAGVGLMQGCYGPGIRKSKQERFEPKELWIVAPPNAPIEAVRQAATRAGIEGRAVALAQELVNLPPCELYPETFAGRAVQVANTAKIEFSVLDEKQLEAEKMRALLAVARGSDRPPRLVVLRYRGTSSDKTLGLVGKGVTFDSGGLSLKTNEQMLDMKCDMAGAAAVLGAVSAIAELKLPVNVLGVLALVENLPSGKAMKLGDVLQARNGKTIEVHNTDAEGRVILADALSYAVDQKATRIVDLATLTGACMVALGEEVAGLMSNDPAWSDQVAVAAWKAGEYAWPLPMYPFYAEKIKGDVGDIRNSTGKRYAGAITAAKFLENFVGATPWAHLDIAGPAWAEHESPTRDAGGTGFGVRTLIELARDFK